MTLTKEHIDALVWTIGGCRISCTQDRAKVYVGLRDLGLIEMGTSVRLDLAHLSGAGRVDFTARCTAEGLRVLNEISDKHRESAERAEFKRLRLKYGYETDPVSADEANEMLANALQKKTPEA
ncbi:hypothetical protein [Hyphomicrobium sp. CS1GBMeth3]|uniref:hypothetical protein n=1 Tax=Hyphomicrobium sp. CS1GBMeth3 TaxID=1892845 RepID=UPI0009307811|nr:hypothetical protein [Hyphomicrobium sp. CS1GBMeth3]